MPPKNSAKTAATVVKSAPAKVSAKTTKPRSVPKSPAPVPVPESPAPAKAKVPRKKATKSADTSDAKKKPKKDPAEPKRYCSAYILYSNDNRQKVKDSNPTASATEIMSLLGKAWKAADDETKALYEQASADAKVQYESNMVTFKETHPQAGGAKEVDPNKPKRGSTAYILFSNDQRASVKAANPDASAKEIMSLLGAAWKAIDDATKAKFEELAQKDRIRYETEMTAYKA